MHGVEMVCRTGKGRAECIPAKFFQGFLFFLASVRDVLFYFLKFLKKLKKKIEYTDLRSKCSRIYSDTKLTAKQYHLEVILISE